MFLIYMYYYVWWFVWYSFDFRYCLVRIYIFYNVWCILLCFLSYVTKLEPCICTMFNFAWRFVCFIIIWLNLGKFFKIFYVTCKFSCNLFFKIFYVTCKFSCNLLQIFEILYIFLSKYLVTFMMLERNFTWIDGVSLDILAWFRRWPELSPPEVFTPVFPPGFSPLRKVPPLGIFSPEGSPP